MPTNQDRNTQNPSSRSNPSSTDTTKGQPNTNTPNTSGQGPTSTDRNKEPLRSEDRKDGKNNAPGTAPDAARTTASDRDRNPSKRQDEGTDESDSETRGAE